MISLNMIPISKKQFLEEHNRLSPPDLKATLALLNRFKKEKRPLLEDDSWCLDKLRIPFILWFKAIKKDSQKKVSSAGTNNTYRNYPETHLEN